MNNVDQDRKITIITGTKGEGKSTFLSGFISAIRDSGISIQGLFSPAIFTNGIKTGIAVENLATCERKQLAYFDPGWDPEMKDREWRFDAGNIIWGNQVLKKINTYSDILIVDEVGYLELEKHSGWNAIFPLLRSNLYAHAYLIVRESLVGIAQSAWKNARVIRLSEIEDWDMWIANEIRSIPQH